MEVPKTKTATHGAAQPVQTTTKAGKGGQAVDFPAGNSEKAVVPTSVVLLQNGFLRVHPCSSPSDIILTAATAIIPT